MEIDSLDAVLEYLNTNEVTDKRIYAKFAPTNVVLLKQRRARFERVAGAIYKKKTKRPKKKTMWVAQQRRLKGFCFEQIMKAFLPPAFLKWERVQTPTNELDILLVLGPTCRFFPGLRDWGPYCICECKSNEDKFSVTWVDKLAGVLDKHNAQVGLVMTQRAPKTRGNAARAVQSIRDYAIGGRFIVLVDLADVERCVNGENALYLVIMRYIETRLGVDKYKLISRGGQ